MVLGASASVARQLERLFEGGSAAGLSDRELLERYLTAGCSTAGEAAFAALVARHSAMVMSVCHQILGDRHDAEDAFQAVFLVLARKARSIREQDLLGNWLYGVASRTARYANQQIAQRRQREGGNAMFGRRAGASIAVEPTAPASDVAAIEREQAEAIHRAIEHLPQVFRVAVVLFYFEGLTLEEAAQRLGCPAGTMRSRLAHAHAKLRRALLRGGVALPAVALTAALARASASTSVPSFLCDATARAALAFAARNAVGGVLSAPVAALAREVLRTMATFEPEAVRDVRVAAGCVGDRRRLGGQCARGGAGPEVGIGPSGRSGTASCRPSCQAVRPGGWSDARYRTRARPAGQAGAGRGCGRVRSDQPGGRG